MAKSLFEKMLGVIDAAIVDQTLSTKHETEMEKERTLNRLVLARNLQMKVAELMDKVYVKLPSCEVRNPNTTISPGLKALSCSTCSLGKEECKNRSLKRLTIEGDITLGIDALPDDPCCNCEDHRTGRMTPEEARKAAARLPIPGEPVHIDREAWGLPPKGKKIDPRKTWQI